MNTNEILRYFQTREQEILRSIRALVEIETPSRDVSGSVRIVDLICSQIEKLKCVDSIERVFAENYGEHLIVRAFSNSHEKSILLLGHLDTVYPVGTLSERSFRIENDRVFAPGIFDMKSGAALMFEALRCLEDLGLKPFAPITILLTCDEEIGSNTSREIVEREARNALFCLVCEPAAPFGKVKTGRKGVGGFQVKAHGIASHAGLEPEKGASAIVEIARQIQKIHALNDFEKGTTLNVGKVRGGTATNVVADFAACNVDVRFTVMSEALRIEQLIRNLTPFDERIKLEIIGEINRPPLERTTEIVKLFEKAREIAASFDYELGETQVGGASDGNFVAASGVPVLDGLGVSGGGAHSIQEHVLLSDIAKRATLITSLLIQNN
ncbi:MAG: M20 family metallopeptidase [Pyrinomonadaceae bacterium]|nr:M20 family metallopeptidase [Pyrinomonadaceae bacterium]